MARLARDFVVGAAAAAITATAIGVYNAPRQRAQRIIYSEALVMRVEVTASAYALEQRLATLEERLEHSCASQTSLWSTAQAYKSGARSQLGSVQGALDTLRLLPANPVEGLGRLFAQDELVKRAEEQYFVSAYHLARAEAACPSQP
jgi:hypothetical protein